MSFIGKEKAFKQQTEFWVVSTHAVKTWGHLNERIGQVIRLQNDINFSETLWTL